MSAVSRMKPSPVLLLFVAGVCLLGITLRIVSLDSDAYPRLSWSTALLTDEGYYIHNARNLVLFGVERTDEFNNMLLMAPLHAIQVLVFRTFGAGAIQARSISVVMSLLALAVFYAALRRAYGVRVAGLGTLFLGLDHTYLLYNRMALMDTPASLFLVGAFWAFVRSQEAVPTEAAQASHRASGPWGKKDGWALLLCGILLLLAYAIRGLCGLMILVPILALWQTKKDYRTFWWKCSFVIFGFCVCLLLYLILWYLPNREEIARTSRYYVSSQLLPRHLLQLGQNLYLNLLGDARGMASFLFRHTPLLFSLSCLGLLGWGSRKALPARSNQDREDTLSLLFNNPATRFLMGWLLLYWLFLAGINYNPSRYYVLFMPAMAGIAALVAVHFGDFLNIPRKVTGRSILLAVFLCYHLLNAAIPVSVSGSQPFHFALCSLLSLAVLFLCRSLFLRVTSTGPRVDSAAWIVAVGFLWAVGNTFWLSDWFSGLTYRQRDADRWLAQNLPRGSVLIGDVAPGLSLNNRFRVVSVIPGLCNDAYPVEKYAGVPRYILILDENRWKEKWWSEHYPELVAPEKRVQAFRQLLRDQFVIGVYEVPHDFGSSGRISEDNLPE